MANKGTIYFTVTNDLTYDQRMQRICSTMAEAGYDVTLVGRKMKGSIPLKDLGFKQKRLSLWFQNGKIFYITYNLRLFFYLLFKKMDIVCAIDLDTILPCLYVSKIKGIKRVYDAHELFTELKEVMSRPKIHQFWMWVEKTAVPQFPKGYTVNQFIVDELARRYQVTYQVVRNLPVRTTSSQKAIEAKKSALEIIPDGKFFLYQGAVNEGRSFETLIPAMQYVEATLVIAGNGNFMEEVQRLIKLHQVEKKVICLGALPPDELRALTPRAYYGLTLFERTGLNQLYSLANRFFDYIQAGIPQICVAYPEYVAINQQYNIAHLVTDLSPEAIANTMNNLLANDVLYTELKANATLAADKLCWENEKVKLIEFYKEMC